MLDIELDEPDIMLIEEPEIHLHPALETSVMRYLKRKSDTSQIFLTTHSTNFIDSGEYSAIHFVQKSPSTVSLLLTEEQAADILPQELGLRLSSLFMYERLVFVEGPSDEDVLREWASTLRCNLSRANVGFVNMGGSRNIKHFASARIVGFLNRRGVQTWFVLDRDENGAEDISKLHSVLGKSCKLTVLPVREIENYLVKPSALSKYISKRIDRSAIWASNSTTTEGHLSAAEVSQVIEQCATDLHTFSLGKALLRQVNYPIYISPGFTQDQGESQILEAIKRSLSDGAGSLAERTAKVDEIASSFKAQFDAAWAEDKLHIAPGTELLEGIFGHYKLAYKKQRDAKGIAAQMEVFEIPQPVCALLQEIAPVEEGL